jgi:hypothetical protein
MKRTKICPDRPLSLPGWMLPFLLGIGFLRGSLAAQTVTRAAILEGSQVVPPVTTNGTGSATIIVDLTSGSILISGSYSGMGSDVISADLHGPASVGSNACCTILSLAHGGGTSGSFVVLGTLSAAQVQDLLNDLHYLDLHTTGQGGGELRGQVCEVAVDTLRNAGTNPVSYTCNEPHLGTVFSATIDMSMTGHNFAWLFGFDSAITFTFPAGQVLLAFDLGGSGELLGQPVVPGPMAAYNISIPNDMSLCGVAVFTQAVHFGGVTPFQLSNARDLVLGI